MTARRALGKGLDSLLGDTSAQPPDAASDGFQVVPIDRLKPNIDQPRKKFDEATIEKLAETIKAHGILQPLLVRRLTDGTFQITAGERRWRGAQMAGLDAVPVIIQENSDEEGLVKSLIENIQRENLNPIDQALAMQVLQDEYGKSQEEIAAETGKDRSAISNLGRLLKLPPVVRNFVQNGELEAGKARALLGLTEQALQVSFAKKAISKRLTVRQVETMVKNHSKTLPRKKINPDVARLQNELADVLGSDVSITQRSKRGGGFLRIQYRNLEQLQSIIDRIKKN